MFVTLQPVHPHALCATFSDTYNSKTLQVAINDFFHKDHPPYLLYSSPVQPITNCLIMSYRVGQYTIFDKGGYSYNMSFKIPSKIGPTDVVISYDVGQVSRYMETLHRLHVDTESSKSLFFHSDVEHIDVFPPGTWHLSLLHPQQISITELFHVDFGVPYLLNVRIQNKLYCSKGDTILKLDAYEFMHHQFNLHESFMIDQSPLHSYCEEVFVTHYSAKSSLYSTEVFINVAPRTHGSTVVVSNAALISRSQGNQTACFINETIVLTEWHSVLDIVYIYTFVNTSTNNLTWKSQFASDVHLLIIKNATHAHLHCQHVKLISVRYHFGVNDSISSIKGRRTSFKYHSARYVQHTCFISL